MENVSPLELHVIALADEMNRTLRRHEPWHKNMTATDFAAILFSGIKATSTIVEKAKGIRISADSNKISVTIRPDKTIKISATATGQKNLGLLLGWHGVTFVVNGEAVNAEKGSGQIKAKIQVTPPSAHGVNLQGEMSPHLGGLGINRLILLGLQSMAASDVRVETARLEILPKSLIHIHARGPIK